MGWYMKALAALAVVAIVGVGYTHYQGLLSDIRETQQALTLEKVRSGELKEARDIWKSQAEAVTRAMDGLADNAAQAETEVERLRDAQEKHDLGALAKGKPSMVERRINRGTASVFGMFEDITSAGGDGRADSPSGFAAPATD